MREKIQQNRCALFVMAYSPSHELASVVACLSTALRFRHVEFSINYKLLDTFAAKETASDCYVQTLVAC